LVARRSAGGLTLKQCLECGRTFEVPDWTCPACGWHPATCKSWTVFAPAIAEQNEGFDPEAFAMLARFEPGHFWFRARNRLIVWALSTYFPDARRFLEIGCGTGYVLTGLRRALPALEVSGSEALNAGLAFARSRLPDVPLFQMDARHIPFDREFDAIGAFDVLEHIDDDEAVLREMFRATVPGGGILVTVPQHQFLWSVVDERSFHQRRYGRRELIAKVERAGFRVVRATSFVSLLVPLAWWSRRRQNQGGFEVESEFNLSRPVNIALERILDCERLMIRSGVSLPFGASLLLVASR
jgi:SAM-dependent methyltransferase